VSAPLRVVWYTDPHNIWCWGCEPAIRRLEVLYPDTVELEIRQGGLFEDFAPVREQWARMSGGRWTESVRAFFDAVAAQHRMPMNVERMTASVDDFSSTWPACIAVKAADLQGRVAGRRYLRRLREAWCLDGRGIHRRNVQESVAAGAGLDVNAFGRALDDGTADAAFHWDREACKEHEVTGFPTFEITSADGPVNDTVRLNGWQPWEAFDDFLRKLAPAIRPRTLEPTESVVEDLLRRYERFATRELTAVLSLTEDDAAILLEGLEDKGKISRRTVGDGLVWELPSSADQRPVAQAARASQER
jgi:putative protein-disulfide isomerase